jgi:hypothetical protein
VFRIDHDVLFNEHNIDQQYLGLYGPITDCLEAYKIRREHPLVSSFQFSGSYDNGGFNPSQFGFWNSSFATRAFPALKVTSELKEHMRVAVSLGYGRSHETTPEQKKHLDTLKWNDYIANGFDEDLMRRFYGLKHSSKLKIDENHPGIVAYGAHPTSAVISGALQCFSEGATLDLPPFSNFRLNVVWIDDHLRYSLHRELGHFPLNQKLLASVNKRFAHAKLDNTRVTKIRDETIPANLPNYLLGKYLPSLLWGAVLDRWIQPQSILKFRRDEVSDDAKRRLAITRKQPSTGILTKAIQIAVKSGYLSEREKVRLRTELRTEAMKRIRDVQMSWIALTADGSETFASIWAKGLVRHFFPSLSKQATGLVQPSVDPSKIVDLSKIGDYEIDKDSELASTHLNPSLLIDLGHLIEDAIGYIEWVLVWPTIVSVIRSVKQGDLRIDLTYRERTASSKEEV